MSRVHGADTAHNTWRGDIQYPHLYKSLYITLVFLCLGVAQTLRQQPQQRIIHLAYFTNIFTILQAIIYIMQPVSLIT